MHEMPIALNICHLDDGDGMVSTLVSSKARYYDSTDSSLTIQKLKCTQRQGQQKEPESSDTGVVTKFTRSSGKSKVSASSSLKSCKGRSTCSESREAITKYVIE